MHNLCDECDRGLNNAILLRSYLTHLMEVIDPYTDEMEAFVDEVSRTGDSRLMVNISILNSSLNAFPVICGILITELNKKYKLQLRESKKWILPEPEGEM